MSIHFLENSWVHFVLNAARSLQFKPIPENAAIYDRLYKEYTALHDYFGRGANDVMKRLKALKEEVARHA